MVKPCPVKQEPKKKESQPSQPWLLLHFTVKISDKTIKNRKSRDQTKALYVVGKHFTTKLQPSAFQISVQQVEF